MYPFLPTVPRSGRITQQSGVYFSLCRCGFRRHTIYWAERKNEAESRGCCFEVFCLECRPGLIARYYLHRSNWPERLGRGESPTTVPTSRRLRPVYIYIVFVAIRAPRLHRPSQDLFFAPRSVSVLHLGWYDQGPQSGQSSCFDVAAGTCRDIFFTFTAVGSKHYHASNNKTNVGHRRGSQATRTNQHILALATRAFL